MTSAGPTLTSLCLKLLSWLRRTGSKAIRVCKHIYIYVDIGKVIDIDTNPDIDDNGIDINTDIDADIGFVATRI